MKNTIKPILRYYGSKYKMLPQIFSLLDLKETDNFLDMFGGSGIVGVNAKHLYNCRVTINDYDLIFPLTKSKALRNLLTFEGNGKDFTNSSLQYAYKRIENGYWNKYEQFNKIIKQCHIFNRNWLLHARAGYHSFFPSTFNKVYADPPYYGKTGLYKTDWTTTDHIILNQFMNNIKKNMPELIIVISYNDCPEIRYLYRHWNIIETKQMCYQSGRKNKKIITKELLITNEFMGIQERSKEWLV